MWSKVTLVGLVGVVGLVAVASAQNDGRYRPTPTLPYYQRPRTTRLRPTVIGDGRYRPSNDGRYRGASDGRYRGGNDGRYVHQDVPYVHDDRAGGQYEGDKNRFGPGGGGSGGVGTFGGAGRSRAGGNALSSAGSAGNRANLASRTTTTRRPTPKTTAVTPALPKGSGTGEGGGGWRILQLFDKEEKDGYQYIYETENGILAEESGRIEQLAPEKEGLRSTGFYEYTGDDGVLYRVDYVADDNGFVARGAHIPTPPPYVAKLLAYLAANAKN
ncbi:larval cuticle protein LCP-30-like [Bactrocera tryoni]|uniref:larval cuticle protein LCP-30-like n=1 Tax=Bactrocera tryoni TaxID=59916 RepID=UPI001A97386A|nr:larval cuticle protein LCP-30-like [Bactrocera tryoni]